MQYPLRLKLGVVAAVCFFVGAIGVVSLIFWRQGSLVPTIGNDAAWIAYKLDRDTVELRSQVCKVGRTARRTWTSCGCPSTCSTAVRGCSSTGRSPS